MANNCVSYSTCCEHNLELNKCLQLQLPGIALSSEAHALNKAFPAYVSFAGATAVAETGQVSSLSSNASALANKVALSADFQIDYIVTASQIAAAGSSLFGFNGSPSNISLSSIRYGVGVDASNNIQAFENGTAVGTSPAAAVAGQVLSVIVSKDGKVVYLLNGVKFHDSVVPVSSDLYVAFFAENPNVTLGGPAQATWSIVTPGNAISVGTVSATGLYCAPAVGGDFIVRGDVNGFTWDAKVRVTKPTVAFSDIASFSEGEAEVWLNTAYVESGQAPRLAADGSPDSFTSPKAVFAGLTVDGFEFEYAPTYTEHRSDRGIYKRTLNEERAYLRFTALEVRDIEKLKLFQPTVTVSGIQGGRQVRVGGKDCTVEFPVTIVKRSSDCDDANPKFDTLQLHRATSVKGFKTKYARDGRQMIEVELEVLLDTRRPKTDQLYTITYQNSCS